MMPLSVKNGLTTKFLKNMGNVLVDNDRLVFLVITGLSSL